MKLKINKAKAAARILYDIGLTRDEICESEACAVVITKKLRNACMYASKFMELAVNACGGMDVLFDALKQDGEFDLGIIFASGVACGQMQEDKTIRDRMSQLLADAGEITAIGDIGKEQK